MSTITSLKNSLSILKLPLQSELKEISVTTQPEPVQPALPVVNLQSPLVGRVPVGAYSLAIKAQAPAGLIPWPSGVPKGRDVPGSEILLR